MTVNPMEVVTSTNTPSAKTMQLGSTVVTNKVPASEGPSNGDNTNVTDSLTNFVTNP